MIEEKLLMYIVVLQLLRLSPRQANLALFSAFCMKTG